MKDKIIIHKNPKSYFKNFNIPNTKVSNINNYLSLIIYFIHNRYFLRWKKESLLKKIAIKKNCSIGIEYFFKERKENIILFSPGLGQHKKNVFFESILNYITNTNYSFGIYWKRGILDDNEESEYSPIGFTEDYAKAINTVIKDGYKNIFLLNSSMGCYCCLRYMSNNKFSKPGNIKGAIYVSCGPKIQEQIQNTPILFQKSTFNSIRTITDKLNKYKSVDTNIPLVEFIGEIESINYNISSEDTYDNLEFSDEDCKNIKIPSVFINSEDDMIAKIAYIKEIIPKLLLSKCTILMITQNGSHSLFPTISRSGIQYFNEIFILIDKIYQFIINNKSN